MTLPPFLAEAVAGPPSWMDPHHPLSQPEVLRSTVDPAIRAQWREAAEWGRDQTVRLWTLERHAIVERAAEEVFAALEADPDVWEQTPPGPLEWRGHRQTTPSAADAWFDGMAKPPGHRYLLFDPTAPNRVDNLLEDTEES